MIGNISYRTLIGLTFTGIAVSALSSALHAEGNRFTGNVERVWEDGFSLNTGDRTIRVDSWDVYGDNTPQNVSVGDRLAVTGEFEGGEFDANFIFE